MPIFEIIPPVKTDDEINNAKQGNYALLRMLTAKKEQLKSVLSLLEEFKMIDSSMNEYKQELHRLISDKVYEQKLKHINSYINALQPLVEALTEAKKGPAAATDTKKEPKS